MEIRDWLVVIAAVPLLIAGLGHTLLAVDDAIRPSQFDPVDEAVRTSMRATGMS